MPRPGVRSLYLHFPFCETKCHYCDFYSIGRERTGASDPLLFESALRDEIQLLKDQPEAPLLHEELESIFMGGGTPSMTPPEAMARAIEPLWSLTKTTAQTEWTMEANPSSVDIDRLRAYRALGVNRISMGVQALNDDLLLRLGRVHSSERALKSLDSIFEAGFENVSVDLLCGVPGQTQEELRAALRTLTRFPITHLSCYLLTLPRTHRMYRELPPEDEQLGHLLLIHDWMTEQGFEHYEISNFAKPGKQARHNLAYWKRLGYLGLGPSAHSFDPGQGTHGSRWKNVSSLHKYSRLVEERKLPIEWRETLTAAEADLEKWMLALRLAEGFPTFWLDTPSRQSKAEQLILENLLQSHPEKPNYLQLTSRGFALSDQVIAALA
ncbi:MAG: hypothetical protein RJB38_359 [Pseudomonadota bacterium]|jgi:oxygen-independent coproporphyrinogen-3 oxidase